MYSVYCRLDTETGRGGAGRYHGYGALPYSYASDACGWARDLNGATRNARTKKSIGTGTVC